MRRNLAIEALLPALLAAATLVASPNALAHGGGLDAAGCHHDRKNGGYHCHRAGYVRPSAPIAREPEPERLVPNSPTAEPSPHSANTPAPPSSIRATDWQLREQQQRSDRAAYWKERGLDFDPKYMSAYAMDQKAKDVERARFWSEKGYSFNPQFMSAYAMDQKVKDIERARFWNERGHRFNPEYMSAYAMDQRVKDIERAKYWAERGLSFNPDYMSAYAMDREAAQMQSKAAVQK